VRTLCISYDVRLDKRDKKHIELDDSRKEKEENPSKKEARA
jgi:hypothetical protein